MPFGRADVTVESVVNNLRFAGQYYDAETGLHYNCQRYYDPALGRYLTPDPIGLAGGINPYVYCLNDPVNLIDPMGLKNIYFSVTLTSGFVDISSPSLTLSFPFFDGDSFGLRVDGTPSFGVSTSFMGGSVNFSTDNPFSSCTSSGDSDLDDTYIYLGALRHQSTYSNLSGTNIGRSFGTGLSLPYVNASTSMNTAINKLSNNVIAPAIQGLSGLLNSLLN